MRRAFAAALAALLLVAVAAPAEAAPYGWRWDQVVEVFDATTDPAWRVAEAVAEWDAGRDGLTIVMTTDLASAEIVVREGELPTQIVGGGIGGQAQLPPHPGGIATGVCRVTLSVWASSYFREHIASHELGHCIGLGHNDNWHVSIMAPTVSGDQVRSEPGPHDYRDKRRVY